MQEVLDNRYRTVVEEGGRELDKGRKVECIAMDDDDDNEDDDEDDDARNKMFVDRVAAISAKDTDRNPRVPTRPTKGPAHTVS
ncbi:hypothetical protein M0802_001133 [Mischocyttarus mexicanus]|nr:hypothetical protein M0802_001133 [Mischocyttarus mexicanus]